jgi:hypothetical protein
MDTYHRIDIDKPDIRDFAAEYLVGIDSTVPPIEVKLMTKADNQGKTAHCTTYATYHVARILNEIEHNMKGNYLKGKPEEGWKLQLQFGTGSEEDGDYVQTAIKSIVKNGLICEDGAYQIDSYARVLPSDINYYIAKGYPIITSSGVTTTNFKSKTFIANKGVWSGIDGEVVGGHAWAIIGFKNGYKWALNSWGDDWGFFKDGTFLVKDEDIKNIDTCYILYDHRDMAMIFKDVSDKAPHAEDIKWCLDKGITLGYNSETITNPADRLFMPTQAITRAEMCSIIRRAYERT